MPCQLTYITITFVRPGKDGCPISILLLSVQLSLTADRAPGLSAMIIRNYHKVQKVDGYKLVGQFNYKVYQSLLSVQSVRSSQKKIRILVSIIFTIAWSCAVKTAP